MRSAALSIALLATCIAAIPTNAADKSTSSNALDKLPCGVGIPIKGDVDGSAQIQGTITKEITLDRSNDNDNLEDDDDLDLDASIDAELDASASLEKRDDIATTFRRSVIKHHNFHRFNHSSEAIKWNSSLAQSAKKVAATCVWAHKMDVNGGGYGQNIAVGLQAPDVSTVISDLFYNNEIKAYKGKFGQQPNTNNFEEWGHLTQVVWANSRTVGCAVMDCTDTGMQNWPYKDNAYFTVCNYYPPGNYNNDYARNVGASQKFDTVTGKKEVNRAAIAKNSWPGKAM